MQSEVTKVRPDGKSYEDGWPQERGGRLFHSLEEVVDFQEAEKERIAKLPPIFSPERLAEIAAQHKEQAEEDKRLGIIESV
jgi:hypothetical protein